MNQMIQNCIFIFIFYSLLVCGLIFFTSLRDFPIHRSYIQSTNNYIQTSSLCHSYVYVYSSVTQCQLKVKVCEWRSVDNLLSETVIKIWDLFTNTGLIQSHTCYQHNKWIALYFKCGCYQKDKITCSRW